MKLPWAGWSTELKVAVVGEVRHWWPSALRPHWYKSPYEAASVLEVATWLAPRFRSIQVFPVVGLVTSTMAVGPFAQKTLPAGYCEVSVVTGNTKLQDCPPKETAKVAFPTADGVPVMV